MHSEPNYGVLWFFYKNSLLDNAIDIWENADYEIGKELKNEVRKQNQVNWLGSKRLVEILENGMRIGVKRNECTFEEKIKVVYGFEQILPVINHI